MLKREQIVKMTKMTLARTLTKASGTAAMSEKHRKRLAELKKRKLAGKDGAQRRLRVS